MNNLIKSGIKKSISFIKTYVTTNSWIKDTLYNDQPIEINKAKGLSSTNTISKVYHLLSYDDRCVILCVLDYFADNNKYEKIGRSYEHGKLPFVNLMYVYLCLKQGLEAIKQNRNLNVNPDKGETLVLQVTTGFYTDGDSWHSSDNKDYKEIDVTKTWTNFKKKEQRIKDLIILLRKNL